jgi:zinc and cadmium transporter
MNEYAWLAVYSLLILGISLSGGSLPFLGRITHSRLQYYLSLSAGVMLGASFFHVMPDAIEYSGQPLFGWWMSLAVVGLFCIERFIAPHSHEVTGAKPHQHGENHHHEEHHHEHSHYEEHAHHGPENGHEHHDLKKERAAAPAMAGWMAVVGLTIHTFMNGVGLGGAVATGLSADSPEMVWGIAIPGFAMFLAIFLHKPADALAISTVLFRKGVTRQVVTLVQLGFGLTVALGVLAFLVTRGVIEESMRNQLTGFALSFSAGTFLFIALSDLLPEVQFHRHDRIPLFLCLCAGVILMGFIAFLEGDEHHGPKNESETAVRSHVGHDHDSSHSAHHDDDDDD